MTDPFDRTLKQIYNEERRLVILVTGGRDYKNMGRLTYFLDSIKDKIFMVVQGGATGADKLAKKWADQNEIWCLNCPAEWKKYNKGAGSIRNKKMVTFINNLSKQFDVCPVVLATLGGSGTQNCIGHSKEVGFELFSIDELEME